MWVDGAGSSGNHGGLLLHLSSGHYCPAMYCSSCTAACTAPCVLQGYDIMEDIYSAKTAAMTFLHELCKARAKGTLDMLMPVGGHGWGGWKLEVSQYVAHGWLGRLVGDGSGGCCGAPCLCRYYVACLTICPSFPPSLLSLSLLRPAVPAAPGGGAE